MRNGSFDHRIRLFLAPFKEGRQDNLCHFMFTPVGFDEFHQIGDGVMDVLDQKALGFSDFATLRSIETFIEATSRVMVKRTIQTRI